MYKTNIFCYNCGNNGHISKICHFPIISNGIICFKKTNNAITKKTLKFIVIRRKYTLGYTNFIRGLYNLEKNSLLDLINIMTLEEKQKVQLNTFDFLWKDLWMIEDINNTYYNEYEKSKIKFNQLKSKAPKEINLNNIIKLSNTNYIEPEWGFPKGRRNNDENNLECAIREFEEETNLEDQQYKLLNLKPIIEDFMGTDNKKYRNIYYIAEYTDNENKLILSNNNFQQAEISDIRFMSFNEIKEHIRPYDSEKLNVLESLINSLKFIYKIK
tara:strand:+ start:326 stop:1138 length:813 start_codon:yes stop_codon:yes gene_type:complete